MKFEGGTDVQTSVKLNTNLCNYCKSLPKVCQYFQVTCYVICGYVIEKSPQV